ncbi:MAG: hypothetical protein ACOYT4_00525 [Nanoarchaeota archaeon]
MIGGIKIALEHDNNLERIKQSFINAGYNAQDIEKALLSVKPSQAEPETNQKNFPPLPIAAQPPKKSAKKLKYIIIILILALILISAGLVWLYWDKLIGLF